MTKLTRTAKWFDGLVGAFYTSIEPSLKEKSGIDGFGYDPIFKPNGFNQTFAEMSMKQKNEISHRGIAVRKLIEYLNKYNFQ